MTLLNDKARKAVLETLDSLRQWSDEIDAANDRHLTKALDHMGAAQQAMGWPDHVSTGDSGLFAGGMHYFLLFAAVRDSLVKASKLQTAAIEKVAEACFASRLI